MPIPVISTYTVMSLGKTHLTNPECISAGKAKVHQDEEDLDAEGFQRDRHRKKVLLTKHCNLKCHSVDHIVGSVAHPAECLSSMWDVLGSIPKHFFHWVWWCTPVCPSCREAGR